MTKVEKIKSELANLKELEKKRFEEEQILLKELRKAEKEEKENKYPGMPQLFRYNFGYGGYAYIAATTKEEAMNIFRQQYPSAKKGIENDIETLGLQCVHFDADTR